MDLIEEVAVVPARTGNEAAVRDPHPTLPPALVLHDILELVRGGASTGGEVEREAFELPELPRFFIRAFSWGRTRPPGVG